jgi:glycosyltransferase involved in cell wall biosynthesis
LPSADIIFCEWALGNAVWYSQHKLSHQKLIVRLHLQEMKLPYLDQILWENVDALILICPLNYNLILERFPFLNGRAHLIYNPIDCNAFNQPKLPSAEFNLGIMGISPMRKAPHIAIEIFIRLKKLDSRYTLFVKGKHPRDYDWLWKQPVERAYFEKFYEDVNRSPYRNSVVFETYGDDVASWFSKLGFVLSTSDFEGSHQSVAEGMASGTIPIIRNWDGADMLYPEKFVFTEIDQAVNLVQKWQLPEHYSSIVDEIKTYACNNFHRTKINQQYGHLITNILKGRELV